ncbi:hypothetical protein [Salipiger sp. PrR007]|uniref:hypothetical protein n=1 Tax=Salipiger sp. PrR007 TaxID=2706884 RepID=UPI0013B90C1A|nr:hypothetical protein [Salipiger sp. PrR007]NDW34688.1 hypothetical protein [Salipiger sp. PrR007]
MTASLAISDARGFLHHAAGHYRMRKRAAAAHFNISRDTAEKALTFSVPPGYRVDLEQGYAPAMNAP